VASPSDAVQRQIEYLGEVISELESRVIDPQEFGKLQGQVQALEAKVDTIGRKLDDLVTLAHEGKGGIRALWAVGGLIAGVLGWLGVERVLK